MDYIGHCSNGYEDHDAVPESAGIGIACTLELGVIEYLCQKVGGLTWIGEVDTGVIQRA